MLPLPVCQEAQRNSHIYCPTWHQLKHHQPCCTLPVNVAELNLFPRTVLQMFAPVKHGSQRMKMERVLNGDLRMLSLLQRLNIAIDVASVLDYLHHHCEDQIVHCDLKPSNILLNNNMTAHVGDFGLVRFIPEASSRSPINQTSSVGLKGTVGYAAPEYGMGSKVTTYGDVYSFGILLLEMFTGKKPTDDMFKDGLQLHNFVKNALPEHISEVLEPLFVEGGEGEDDHLTSEEKCIVGQRKNDLNQECLIAILRIGVACSVESPRGRMDMSHVVKELQLVRDTLIGSGVD